MKKFLKKIKRIILTKIYTKKYKDYKKFCQKQKQKEFLIFNSPIHGNIGDHAIIYAEYKLLEKLNIRAFEIPTFQEKYYFDYIKKNISQDAIISITGGGFIGSQWLEEQSLVLKVIQEFYQHKIIIFPSTLYFKDSEQGKADLKRTKEIFNKAEDLTIFTREDKTYEFAKEQYKTAKIYLAPDIVLSLNKMKEEKQREGILICLRKDVEKNLTEEKINEIIKTVREYDKKITFTDTVMDYPISIKDREKEFNQKMDEFAKVKLVITDRLHGMIFAYLTNTPCIVFSNYNYKVEGVYQWIKEKKCDTIIYETTIDKIKEDVEKMYNKQSNLKKIEDEFDFDELRRILKSL